MLRVCTRPMIRMDFRPVALMEQSVPGPWTEQNLLAFSQARGTQGLVVETADQKLAGYLLLSLHRRHYAIERLVIHPDYRRRGIGTFLLNLLKNKLQPDRRNRIRIWVPDDSRYLGAHLWLRQNQFAALGVEDEYIRFIYHRATQELLTRLATKPIVNNSTMDS